MKPSFLLATLSFSSFLILTTVASADSATGVQAGMGTFAELINTFNKTIVKALGVLFMSGAVVAFFFGLANFIWGLREGKTDAISKGREFMIWSLIALFVMFSVYGIINLFRTTLGVNQNTITIPEINYGGGSGTQNPTQRTNGSPCTSPSQCSSNYCINSLCAVQPTLKLNGEQCSQASECSSNYCSGGVCAMSPQSADGVVGASNLTAGGPTAGVASKMSADVSYMSAECVRFKGKWDNINKKCTFSRTVVLDPTVTVWDGGSKPCPTGSNYNKQGVCVKVTTPEAERDKIEKRLKNKPQEADQTEIDQRYLSLAEGHTKFVYEVNNGQLVRLIGNSTESKDEKPNKTMWAMFVLANEPDIVNKIKLFVAAPEIYDISNRKLGGFVSQRNGADQERSVLALATNHLDENGNFDTVWAYQIVTHEGAHIPTAAPRLYDLIDFTKKSCSTFLWTFGNPVYGSCFKANTLTSNFVQEFYVRSGNSYSTIQGITPEFVSEYAGTRPTEDIAETYSTFKLLPKPSDDTIASQKIRYFYTHDLYGNTKDMTYVKDAFIDALYAEVRSRGQDSDRDGLNDIVEMHRGTNPNKSDTDGDGAPDNQDVDAEGDGYIDTQNADVDDDGDPNYRDTDDDGDGTPDQDDADDNGDGITDTRQNGIGDEEVITQPDEAGSGYDPVTDPSSPDPQVNIGTDPFDPTTVTGSNNIVDSGEQATQESVTDTPSDGFWTDTDNDYIPDSLEFWKD